MIYRTASLEDIKAIRQIFDEERLKWPAYYPSLSYDTVYAAIEAAHKFPKDFFGLVAERDGEVVGYVSVLTHKVFNIKVAEDLGLFVSTVHLTPMETVNVVRNIVRRTHYWAMNVGCEKMLWVVTVGKWKSFQAIVASEGCTQVGVTMEFNHGKRWSSKRI